MFKEDDVALVRKMYANGRSPSSILRHFVLSPNMGGVPALMYLLRDAFGLEADAVQCIGGWWYDDTGELTDQQLDAFLAPAIDEALGRSVT
jgi:hypothetical protein